MKSSRILFAVLILSGILFSCVSPRVVEDLKKKKENCEADRDQLKVANDSLSTQNNEMSASLEKLTKDIKELRKDTSKLANEIRDFIRNKKFLTDQYEQIYKNYERLKTENDDLSKKLSSQLMNTENSLYMKQDELKKLERDLQAERMKLDRLKNELEQKESELNTKDLDLQEKSKKIDELQGILNRKDSLVNALRNKVQDALIGFEGDGLSIEVKNGKVYVSLDEKLLFKKGSSAVDPKGQKAIKKLAKVLEKNPDININIEGHTDVTGTVDSNWLLSVKRAVSIVKIISDNSDVDPKRMTASGRGQFMPVDPGSTEEAYSKNRRTEIILTPKLDELMQLLEGN